MLTVYGGNGNEQSVGYIRRSSRWRQAVRLAQEVGVTEAARRLDMPMTSTQNWMKSEPPDVRGQTLGKKITEEQVELSRLRREVVSLKVDSEILRKAAAYFAKGSR